MPTLASSELCTGCAACLNACAQSAITMKKTTIGFLIPIIDTAKCVDCGRCEKACPPINPLSTTSNHNPKTYAMWSEPDRQKSSSGGAFSAFARYVLKQNGVVFGATFDKDLHCKHIEIQKVEDLDALRGSKYVQSQIGDTFKRIKYYLKNNRKVLFCGTPCQVAGLRKFLLKPDPNLLTLDLICHGVPSEAVFHEYIKKISKDLNIKIDGYEFRDRDGWAKAPYISVCGKFHRVYGVEALYMEAFNAAAIFRECCYNCHYSSLPRVGDCTIGDFWGIGRYGKPFKHDTMKGVSLVLANTKTGEIALHQLERCYIEERTLEEALIENQSLKNPSRLYPNHNNIIKDFLNPQMTLKAIDSKYKLVDHSLKATVKNISSRLGLFTLGKRIYNWYKTIS